MKNAPTKVTEAHVQAILMRWLMREKRQQFILPNSNSLLYWEADLISLSMSRYISEYEVKLTRGDYRNDFKKTTKHQWLALPNLHTVRAQRVPNYFWYVTFDFEIEPPEYAGWIRAFFNPKSNWHKWRLEIKKPAPRLHRTKYEGNPAYPLRLLSFHLANFYEEHLLTPTEPRQKLGGVDFA